MISFTLYLTLKSFVNKLERNSASFKEDHSNIYPIEFKLISFNLKFEVSLTDSTLTSITEASNP